MAFLFDELPRSRGGSALAQAEVRRYYASGSTDASFVYAYAQSATPNVITSGGGILYRQDIALEPGGAAYFIVTVPYGPKQKFEQGQFSLSFDTTGGTAHVVISKETRNSYPPGAPDFKQAIAVNGDNVDGTEVIIPALKITATFRHPAAVITIPKIKFLATITGKVNSDSFLGFAPGEVLFLGCTGEQSTDAPASVQYHFACSQNASGLSFGDIAGVVKRGWDVVWIKFKPEADGGSPILEPEFAYVERVYDEVALATALGFGA